MSNGWPPGGSGGAGHDSCGGGGAQAAGAWLKSTSASHMSLGE